MSDEPKFDAAAMIRLMEDIKGADTPVAAQDIAALYMVMATQMEAMIAVYGLAMRANPNLLFSDPMLGAQSKLRALTENYQKAVATFKKRYEDTGPGNVH